jgi:threonine dehydrogenase-like Zn-dependent dehydrogenase
MPTMKSGDILGHEFMGEVIETGSAHTRAVSSRVESLGVLPKALEI